MDNYTINYLYSQIIGTFRVHVKFEAKSDMHPVLGRKLWEPQTSFAPELTQYLTAVAFYESLFELKVTGKETEGGFDVWIFDTINEPRIESLRGCHLY